jgi:hypothetical protein
MKTLILNQCFYPDVVATAQHAADLSQALLDRRHEVSVIASRRAYSQAGVMYEPSEVWRGVDIKRVSVTSFGKGAKWRRAVDFASFFVTSAWQLLRTPKQDVVIALTTPPLLSVWAALFVAFKGGRLVCWTMDLNPDEAIAAGWLRDNSAIARLLKAALNFSLRRAHQVIALDHYMAQRLEAKGVPPERISTMPPWSHDNELAYNPAGREAFRAEHGLTGKFVVMYSGNHSPCHPLDSLLESALQLKAQEDVHFLFVGGGSEFNKVIAFKKQHSLTNITCLPYQPMGMLSASLSAADLHVVVMGAPFVGIIHPCKIYNILTLGIPCLYIGPPQSHVMDLEAADRDEWLLAAEATDAAQIRRHILSLRSRGSARSEQQQALAKRFSYHLLANQLVDILESAAAAGTEGVPTERPVSASPHR